MVHEEMPTSQAWSSVGASASAARLVCTCLHVRQSCHIPYIIMHGALLYGVGQGSQTASTRRAGGVATRAGSNRYDPSRCVSVQDCSPELN